MCGTCVHLKLQIFLPLFIFLIEILYSRFVIQKVLDLGVDLGRARIFLGYHTKCEISLVLDLGIDLWGAKLSLSLSLGLCKENQ